MVFLVSLVLRIGKKRARPGALRSISEFGENNLYPIHVLGLQTLRPLLDLELHLRAFIQGTVAVRLDGQAPFRTPGLTRLPWISGALCRKFAGSPVCPRVPDPPGLVDWEL